jgi:tetratricopeptide (TPR) repeat protein
LTFVAVGVFAAPGPYDQARELFGRTDYPGVIHLLQNSANDARSIELLGRAYLMETDYKRAVEVFEKGVALDPNSSMMQTWLGRAYGRRAETSSMFSALNSAGKARAALERAVQIDPRNGEALDDLFSYYLDAPGFAGGGMEKARKLVPLIATIDPAQGRFSESRLAEREKEFTAAEKHLRDALAMNPRNPGRFIDLATFLARRGRFDESEKIFEQAMRVAPNAPRVLYAHAEALIHAHRSPELARDLLHRYLSSANLTPEDPSRAEATRLLRQAEGG